MSDFDLDKSRWYNAMKVSLAIKHIEAPAATIAARMQVLSRFPFDPVAVTMLADAEDRLEKALNAVRAAREEYAQGAE